MRSFFSCKLAHVSRLKQKEVAGLLGRLVAGRRLVLKTAK